MSSPSSAPPPPKKRSACDRCHDKKISCIVQDNNKYCVRCQKSGFSCNFSFPEKTGRPRIKPARHDHSRQRRRYTTPSTGYRSRSDSLFSNITPSQSDSLSTSPSTFPPAVLSAPAIHTNFDPTSSLDHHDNCFFPTFDAPFGIDASTLVPPSSEATDIFEDYASSLLTPTSLDQGYRGSWPPVTTISPLGPPFPHLQGSNQEYNPVALNAAQPVFPHPFTNSQMLETLGLNLDGTMRELADLNKALSSCNSSPIATEDLLVEHLLGAVERVPSLLQPYFMLSPSSQSIPTQYLDIPTLTSMIGVVRLATDGLDAVILPSLASSRSSKAHSRMHSLGSFTSSSISPETLRFPSPIPPHQTPCLQLSPTTAFSTPTVPGSSSVAASSPMCFSSSMTSSSSGAPIARTMSLGSLPIVSPVRLGTYISHDPELSRWAMTNIMLFHVRSLSRLHRDMATYIDLPNTPAVSQQLEELGTRMRAVKTGLRRLIDSAGSDDDLYSG